MTPEELDEATVEEAKRRWLSTPALRIRGTLSEDVPVIAARLARENWTPPEPDPDILAFREWTVSGELAHDSAQNRVWRQEVLAGKWDRSVTALGFVAGARMAREQEREKARKREALRKLTELTEEYGGYEELKDL